MVDKSDKDLRVLSALLGTDDDLELLQAVVDSMDAGKADWLLQAMLDHFRAKCDAVQAIAQTMERLEALIARSPKVGGLLMARLYWHADEAYMHDICDAIDLWLSDCTDPDLKTALTKIVIMETDPIVRATYERWSRLV